MKSRQTCDIQQNRTVMFNYGHLCNKWCSKDGKMRYIDNCQTKSFKASFFSKQVLVTVTEEVVQTDCTKNTENTS